MRQVLSMAGDLSDLIFVYKKQRQTRDRSINGDQMTRLKRTAKAASTKSLMSRLPGTGVPDNSVGMLTAKADAKAG